MAAARLNGVIDTHAVGSKLPATPSRSSAGSTGSALKARSHARAALDVVVEPAPSPRPKRRSHRTRSRPSARSGNHARTTVEGTISTPLASRPSGLTRRCCLSPEPAGPRSRRTAKCISPTPPTAFRLRPQGEVLARLVEVAGRSGGRGRGSTSLPHASAPGRTDRLDAAHKKGLATCCTAKSRTWWAGASSTSAAPSIWTRTAAGRAQGRRAVRRRCVRSDEELNALLD